MNSLLDLKTYAIILVSSNSTNKDNIYFMASVNLFFYCTYVAVKRNDFVNVNIN